MIVNWTENAMEHLVGIYEYISQSSPSYGRKMVDRLTRRSEQFDLEELLAIHQTIAARKRRRFQPAGLA